MKLTEGETKEVCVMVQRVADDDQRNIILLFSVKPIGMHSLVGRYASIYLALDTFTSFNLFPSLGHIE